MRKIYYTCDEERSVLIEEAESNGEYLIEDAITFQGNYLVFDTKPLQHRDFPTPLADAYEAIAMLYEETEALKARIAVLEGR